MFTSGLAKVKYLMLPPICMINKANWTSQCIITEKGLRRGKTTQERNEEQNKAQIDVEDDPGPRERKMANMYDGSLVNCMGCQKVILSLLRHVQIDTSMTCRQRWSN